MTHNSSMETSSLLYTFVTVICLMTGWLADYGNAQLVNCKASDRETLIDFKNGLVDPKNLLSSWEGSNCCQWWGVGCNNWTGDVIVVDIHNPDKFLNFTNFSSLAVLDLSHNIFHSFPQWLVNVSSLMYIDLSFNSIWDSIPVGFTKLPNLRFLNLRGNGLMVSTYQLFEESWSKIEVIQLGFNFVQGKLPPSIGNLTSLTHLALPGNSIEGNIPNSIFKLCSLEYLDLSYNNLTGSLPEHLEGTKYYLYESPLPHLQNLVLTRTRLVGILPNWLGQLQNLVQLNLDSNFFHGSVPAAFGTLRHLAISNLSILDVSSNRLTGTLPDSLGKLSELSFLDVSSNCLTGIVSESHFAKLTKIKVLSFSWNSFIFKISPNWDPPFQVESLMLSSCRLGSFPGWLKSQRHLLDLDLSNANMSGPIPSWFWDISGNLSLLNFSSNSLWGQLPNKFKVHFNAFTDLSFNLLEGPIPLPTNQIIILNLSHNNFSGPIPENIGDLSFLSFFSLANNQISGEIPTSIGELQVASVIDLSRNTLTGSIPKSIGNCLYLEVLDLQNNNLSGKIPRSLGQLSDLQTLHLRDNIITGKLPSSNAFSGKIPSALLNLTSLKILDLAENQLSGSIPPGMSNLNAMTQEQNIKQDLIYGWVAGVYYEENVIVNTKGQSLEYTRTLSFLTCIDLSGNYLHGEFPHEVTKLAGLVVLNLSRNQISGQIPQSISELHQLASLDLSCNMFSGPIPSSIISMSFLEFLNMSYNNFSGRIPYAGQMSTFEASSFSGNPGLCGAPLAVECSDSGPSIPGINGEIDNGDGYIVDKWLYLAIGLGFAAGVLIPYLLMAFKRTWSYMYFDSVDKVADALLYLRCKTSACFRNHCYHRR
ncbi:receptor-like protein EIX1 [Manihot esculenta]|uniref:receptor-like protein EIX1 n=1 Tax=Manihot esculenta TaxID=3983 RepID=UPI001CC3E557|nr:receptor-like protein EIX1 [Manihot esculenta]